MSEPIPSVPPYSNLREEEIVAQVQDDYQRDQAAELAEARSHIKVAPSDAPSVPPQPPEEVMKNGIELIVVERDRQLYEKGWTARHDDGHDKAELTAASCCYAALARRQADGTIQMPGSEIPAPSGWPWEVEWWHPSNDPVRNLVKAGALIAAEIERLQRKANV